MTGFERLNLELRLAAVSKCWWMVNVSVVDVCTGLQFYAGRSSADHFEGEILWSVSRISADINPNCPADWTSVCFLFGIFARVDQFDSRLENTRTNIYRQVIVHEVQQTDYFCRQHMCHTQNKKIITGRTAWSTYCRYCFYSGRFFGVFAQFVILPI